MILFLCTYGNAHVVTLAKNREEAKIKSRQWLWHNPDAYIVTPLTKPGDRINLNVALST